MMLITLLINWGGFIRGSLSMCALLPQNTKYPVNTYNIGAKRSYYYEIDTTFVISPGTYSKRIKLKYFQLACQNGMFSIDWVMNVKSILNYGATHPTIS